MKREAQRFYTEPEELAHAITHGVGVFIGIAVLVLLVVFSSLRKGAWEIVSCAIYGATFILLYLGSTLYHSARNPRLRRVLKIIDHAAIYLLIAGTYTPYALAPLRGALGWTIFGAIWGCALIGIFFKVFFTGRFKAVSLFSYLFMGWFCVIAVKPLYRELNTGGFCFSGGRAASATPSVRFSMPGNPSNGRMPSGISSCSPAAFATFSASFSASLFSGFSITQTRPWRKKRQPWKKSVHSYRADG